jgi:hypothetical protein
MYIQDVAIDTLGVDESCMCAGTWGCTWDPDPLDPDNDFDDSGKPYYQMRIGYNTEAGALWAAELMAMDPPVSYPGRAAWCSEAVSYWHRESATPYLRGYYTDWHEHWRVDCVADLRLWYETEEGSSGQGRWIRAREVSYDDFQPGVNAPVPGAYIAIAEYDDVTRSYPDLDWSHSMIVDEMTVHRDAGGNVFQVEVDLLEGNSGNQVKDSGHWDDLLTLTPNGSGWASHGPGPDRILNTADDIRRKVYGIGIDLDPSGQPYYDPARLHVVEHPDLMRFVRSVEVPTSDDDWDDYAGMLLPSAIVYAELMRQGGGPQLKWGLNQGNPAPVPDGDSQNELLIPAGFVGQIIIDLMAPHPLPIEGLELTWADGVIPHGYTVEFYAEPQQWSSVPVPDLSNHPPPPGQPALVPVVMDTAMTGVRTVMLFFPAGSVFEDAVLSELSILFQGAPFEDAPGKWLDVQRPVFVDVKPGSCPNPVNFRANGVLPVAILGTFDLDVTRIDPSSVMAGGMVPPLRWSYEDVGTPHVGGAGGCHSLEGDGILDVTLKFDVRELADALDLGHHGGETLPLAFEGVMSGDGGEMTVLGEDWIRVLR